MIKLVNLATAASLDEMCTMQSVAGNVIFYNSAAAELLQFFTVAMSTVSKFG